MTATWDDDDYVSFDLETSGYKSEFSLQPWRLRHGDAWITSIAWAYRKDGKVVTGGMTDPDVIGIGCFLAWCIREGRTLVGWNVQFDIQWLLAIGLKAHVEQLRYIDGMLMWRHLEIEPEYETTRPSKKSYSLKTAVVEHLPQFAGYEAGIDFHSHDPADREKLHAYNIQDCIFTLFLTRKFYKMLKPRQQQAMWIEAQCIWMVAEANLEGMLVDTIHAAALSQKLKDIAAEKLKSLTPYGVTEVIVRSPNKMGILLFDQWKLPVLKLNRSKKKVDVNGRPIETRSTDKEVLHELAFMDPRAKELREYREALNNDTKFAETPINSVAYCDDECKTHPAARIFGTYSGRLTYSSKQGKGVNEVPTGFALHQEKRGEEFRSIIIAPPGYTIVEFDAAGQEFRWMAIAANDLTMLQLCQPGEDPHGFMGARIGQTDYRQLVRDVDTGVVTAKDLRQLGKVANLCCAAGTTILTDRGPCSIEHVRSDDLVWDGEAFVTHDGVSFSGVRDVITHDGVPATPDHRVLVNQEWVRLDEAQRAGSSIDRAVTQVAGVRIMGGLVRRAVRSGWGALRAGAMRLWGRACGASAVLGDGPIYAVQGLRCATATSTGRQADCHRRRDEAFAEARERMVSALRKRPGQVVSQLRGPGDRVPVFFGAGSGGVHQTNSPTSDILEVGHRQSRQQWSLRGWKLALGYAQSEPRQPTRVATYDIVNCGPRTRFSANGRIVHNSLQYRTSAKKLRVMARVQYDLPMTLPEAEGIHAIYRSTYHRVPDYWVAQIGSTVRRGWVETLAGRRVQVKGDWNGPKGWSMGSTAINYRIQGTGADQKYLALMLIRDYLSTIGARFLLDLHDGIYLLVPDAQAKKAAAYIKGELDNLPYAACWNFIPPVPLPWDCKMGKTWGTLKGFKPGS